MTKKLLVSAVLVSAMFFELTALDACAMHDKGKEHKMDFEKKFYSKAHMVLENSEELGLSDEQVKKVKELKMSTMKDLIKKNAEIEVLAIDIKAEMWADSINVNAVNKLVDKKYDLKKEKTKSLIAACVSLKDILTKEQKEKMKGIWKRHKEDKGKSMKKGMMQGKMKCPMMGDKT